MSKLNEPKYTYEILKEVHRIKDELGKAYEYDILCIVADRQEQEKKSDRVIVKAPSVIQREPIVKKVPPWMISTRYFATLTPLLACYWHQK